MTTSLQDQMAAWRAKIASGTMTQEEYKEVLAALRQGRSGVSQPKAGSRKSAAKQGPDVDALNAELDNL